MYQGTSSPRSTFILASSAGVSTLALASSTADSVVRPPDAATAPSAPDVMACPVCAVPCTVSSDAAGKKFASQQPP